MWNIRVWSAVTFLMLFSFGMAVGMGQEKTETPSRRTERTLDQKVTLALVREPLDEVLKTLAAEFNLKIKLSAETKSGAAAVDPKVPVTILFKKISLRSALHLLLDRHNLEPVVQEDGTLLLVPGSAKLRAERVESETQRIASENLRETLKTVLTGAFTNTPFKNILAFQAENLGCQIVIDPNALSADGVSGEEPVYFVHGPIPLKESLKRLLLPLGLQAIVQDEVILVVARDKKAASIPSPEVDKALATKLDLDFEGPLHEFAAYLAERTGIPFGIRQLELKAVGITLNQKVTVKAKGVTPEDALQLAKLPAKLRLIECDGMLLIALEEKK